MIFDSRYIADYMLSGTMPGSPKPQKWFDENYLRRGETIEDLAVALAIEPAVLRATTARFNQFARAGVDEDFGRGKRAYDRFLGDFTHGPNKALGTVAKAPFYAVPIVPGDVGTFGGVVTDCQARVLREDGSVIPGLYATGMTLPRSWAALIRALAAASARPSPGAMWRHGTRWAKTNRPDQVMVKPASTLIDWPVIVRDKSDVRNKARLATSCGVLMVFNAVRPADSARICSTGRSCSAARRR